MKPAPFHPLNPDNICLANTDAARRDHERYTAQPWSLAVACGMVGSVFFWGMVAVVVSGYFVPEEKGFRQKIPTCPIWPSSTLPEEPEKVICFRPPPPPKKVWFSIPKPTPKEDIRLKSNQRHDRLLEGDCPDCDIYLKPPPPPLPNVDLEERRDDIGIFNCSCREDKNLLQAVLEPKEPEATRCGFLIDEEPRPVNLEGIQSRIRFPSPRKEGKVIVRISINEMGHYRQHEVLTETDARFTEAIVPHLADLRFTPKIRGGRPVLASVTIPFRFELRN